MLDPLALTVLAVFVVVIILLIMARMMQQIAPGKLGLVYMMGQYVRTLRPGFWIVSPSASVRIIVAGSGVNAALGLVGVAMADLDPQSLPGPIQVGPRTIMARSVARINSGASVTVIGDLSPGVVLVASDRTAVHSHKIR